MAIEAVLQQQTKQDWQSLAFLNKKLSAQTKYSPYDKELLAIAVRHFRHMLERRNLAS